MKKYNIVYRIPQLAQEFINTPYFESCGLGYVLRFDYETEIGPYNWTGIFFNDAIEYRHNKEKYTSQSELAAYNAVAEEEGSEWLEWVLKRNEIPNDGAYKHYVVYFDGYGVYHCIAKGFKKLM